MLAFGSFFLFIAFLRKTRIAPCLSLFRSIFSFLIAQKIFALKTRRTKLKPQFRKIVCLMLAFGSFSLFDAILTKDTDCSVSFSFSLNFQFSNRAENLCSQNKTDKTQTAIPQDCLLDARLRLVFPFHRVFTKSTEFPVLFFYSLDFQFSNRAMILLLRNSDICALRR